MNSDRDYRPYVSRLLLEWAAETPAEVHRRIEGTLVFTDLSGFTALSERLGRLGRTGTEELVQHLDGLFDELLGVAALRGGSMVKFGGDALLIFFWGDNHVRRGVESAAAMRAKLRHIGLLSTSAGRVRLRMSIGIHTGAYDFFLLGHSHKDLVVLGPNTTRCVEMEAAANAGQILLSPETAAALPRSAVGQEQGGGFLLARAPSVLVADEAPRLPNVDAEPFVPIVLRPYLGTGRPEQEHRQVAIGFVHVCGLDAPLASGETTAVGDRLRLLMGDVEAILEERGVTLVATDAYHDGFKLLIAAGIPRSWDNNEERLLRAARQLVDAGHGSALRVGIHRGYVFAGDIGASFRRTYAVMGDPVNTAARVMAKSEPGQILTTRDVLDRSRTQFQVIELPPFSAKGKSRPLVAFDVGAVTGTTQVSRAEGLPFVGRRSELGMLVEALQSARDGTGAVIEVVAGRGLGKSRLIDQALSGGPEMPVHRGAGDPYATATAYAGLAPLVRSALEVGPEPSAAVLERRVAELRPDLSPWLPLVAVAAAVPGITPTPEVEALEGAAVPTRLQQVIVELFAACVGPAVFVAEDADRLDQASQSLLAALAAAASAKPWVVVVAARSSVLNDATRIDLEPLAPSEARSLTHHGAPQLLPAEVDAYVQRAEGNPLFLTELLAQVGVETIPDTIEAAVRSRIDELDPVARTVLQRAAVLGRTFDHDLAQAVLGHDLDPVAAGIEEMLERSGSELRFRQALYQEVAYESLSFRRRRELHADVGQALEQLGDASPVEQLSLHFAAAGDWERAWRYSRAAGDGARARFSPHDARTLYHRALEAADKLRQQLAVEDVNRVRYELALSDVYAGRPEEARAQLVRARRREQDATAKARYFYLEAQAVWLAGEYQRALSLLSRGLRLAPAEAAGLRSRMLCVSAKIRTTQGRPRQAAEAARQSAAEAEAAGDEVALAHAHVSLLFALTGLGRHAEAQAYRELPLRVFKEKKALWQLASLEVIIGIAEYEQGRWPEANHWYSRATETASAAGDINQLAMAENNRAEIYLDQGRLDEARTGFVAALTVWRPAHFRVGVAVANANLGRIDGRQGNLQSAQAQLIAARHELEALGVHDYSQLARAWLLEAAALNREDVDGLIELRTEVSRTQATPATFRLLALLDRLTGVMAARQGDNSGAAVALRSSVEQAKRAGSTFEEAVTMQAQTELGLGGPDLAARANTVLDDLGVVWVPPIARRAAPSPS